MYKEYHYNEVTATKQILVSYQRHQILRQKLQEIEPLRQYKNPKNGQKKVVKDVTSISRPIYADDCKKYFFGEINEINSNRENMWSKSKTTRKRHTEIFCDFLSPIPMIEQSTIFGDTSVFFQNTLNDDILSSFLRYHHSERYRDDKFQNNVLVTGHQEHQSFKNNKLNINNTDSYKFQSNLANWFYFTKFHHWSQLIAALAVSLGPLAAGLGKGYASPALASLQDTIHIKDHTNFNFSVNDQEASWIASLSLLGALFGGILGGYLMKFGRKKVLTIIALPFSGSWIITVFARSVETMFVTAFTGGFCCAIVSMVTQVYIAEIADKTIRGQLNAIQKIASHFGILISYSLGAYLDWRQLAMLVSIAPMMLFVTMIYVPESPSFLLLSGQNNEAFQSLKWLRGKEINIDAEFQTLQLNIKALQNQNFNNPSIDNKNIVSQKKDAKSTSTSLWQKLSMNNILNKLKSIRHNKRLTRPLIIICSLMIFQRFTGANSFGFYAVSIFSKTFADLNPHGGAISIGFVQLLAACLSGLLIDIVGRIPLLIISSVFMTLALASFGSYIYYEQTNKLLTIENQEGLVGNTDWIPLLCVIVFTVAFSLGISPISWLLVGELFPLEYRGIGSSIATSFSYFCAFLGVKTFVDFQDLIGLYGTFWLYACISCMGLFFIVMIVPETKGQDLEEMNPVSLQMLSVNQ